MSHIVSVVSGGRYIEVFCIDGSQGKGKRDRKEKEIDRNFTRTLKEDEEEEDVAESGRLFVRNLPYTSTEEEINELFAKHGERTNTRTQARPCRNKFPPFWVYSNFTIFTGPISEVLFPIDNLTKKPKGFAFITYMIPENAVTALVQLDGHIFQVFDLKVIFCPRSCAPLDIVDVQV